MPDTSVGRYALISLFTESLHTSAIETGHWTGLVLTDLQAHQEMVPCCKEHLKWKVLEWLDNWACFSPLTEG